VGVADEPMMSTEPRKSHRLFAALAVIVTLALVVAGVLVIRHVRMIEGAAVADTEENVATPVRVVAVERRAILDQAVFHGFVEPFVQLAVSADVPGEIFEQWVEVADDVKRDQPLYKIDDAVRKIEHEEALAALDRAASDLQLAEANWERIAELNEQQAAGIERTKAETSVLSAKALRRQAEAAVRRTALQLERTVVTSPIDGVVSRIHSRRGEFTQPGLPLAEVIEIDRLKLLTEVEDRHVVWMKVGQQAVLTTKTFPGERFDGKVLHVYPQALPTSRKFEVEIELSNVDRRIRPGFFMSGTVTREQEGETDAAATEVLIVPREAVVELFGRQFCYVVGPGEQQGSSSVAGLVAQRTPVTALPIPADRRNLQIVEGVDEGDLVVTKGLQHLSERSSVRITD
jgi:membrane fusion protein (multidrug efflux system)/multidrug efflux system membrane fusion protein/cobalt-zinc-cadmium efflux system membrane fusion protein